MRQLPTEQLVEIIWQQQHQIEQLQQEIERLKVSLQLNSQNSSKPPKERLTEKTGDAVMRLQTKPAPPPRLPGGQPGHPGKTRIGFGRVDRLRCPASAIMSTVRQSSVCRSACRRASAASGAVSRATN